MKVSMKLVVFLFLLIHISCKTDKDNNLETMSDALRIESSMVMSANSNLKKAQQPKIIVERKLIKNGSLSFETYDLEKTRKKIFEAIKKYKGYTSSDNEYTASNRISNTISIRVPAKEFDNFLLEVSKGVERFDSKNININDVTEQFVDTEARLKTKKKLEVKYLELLKKAKTVREILDVERQLANVRSEIESKEGRLKYLQSQVSFSTLTVTFYKKITSESNFSRKFKNAFKEGFENVKGFLIYIINIWPFILVGILLIFFLRRRRKQKKSS